MSVLKNALHFKMNDVIILSDMTDYDLGFLYRKLNQFRDVCDHLGIAPMVSVYDGEGRRHAITTVESIAPCIGKDPKANPCHQDAADTILPLMASARAKLTAPDAARQSALQILSVMQYACLEVIEKNPGIVFLNVAQMPEFRAVSQSRLAYVQIKALVARGLVTKGRKMVNRRPVATCMITSAGSAALKERRRTDGICQVESVGYGDKTVSRFHPLIVESDPTPEERDAGQ